MSAEARRYHSCDGEEDGSRGWHGKEPWASAALPGLPARKWCKSSRIWLWGAQKARSVCGAGTELAVPWVIPSFLPRCKLRGAGEPWEKGTLFAELSRPRPAWFLGIWGSEGQVALLARGQGAFLGRFYS